MQTPDAIDALVKRLARLPGMGPRSARRVALYLLTEPEARLDPLAGALETARRSVVTCGACGTLDVQSPCRICADTRRDGRVICIVRSVADVWAMERTGFFKGVYHVLGGVLSALDGIGPDRLRIDGLFQRLPQAHEIVLALGATVDGQATAHYLAERMRAAHPGIRLTRLAYGVPVGGEVEHLDDSTLAMAMKSRGDFPS